MRAIAFALCAVLLSSPSRAVAEDHRSAKEAYRDGMKHYDLNEYKEAIEAFKRSFWQSDDPRVLLDLAQCYRGLGVHDEAIKFYRNYLRRMPNAPNRDDVLRTIAVLESRPTAPQSAPPPPVPAPPPVPPPPPVVVKEVRFIPPVVQYTDASADPASRRARAAFEVGVSHLRDRAIEAAIAAFQSGYAAKPKAIFLIKLAECYQLVGQFDVAAKALEAYLDDDETVELLVNSDRVRLEAVVADWKLRPKRPMRPVAPPEEAAPERGDSGRAVINVFRPSNMVGAFLNGVVTITGPEFSRTFPLRNNKYVVTMVPAGTYALTVSGAWGKVIANGMLIDAAGGSSTFVRCEFHKTCVQLPEADGRAQAARCKENVKGD